MTSSSRARSKSLIASSGAIAVVITGLTVSLPVIAFTRLLEGGVHAGKGGNRVNKTLGSTELAGLDLGLTHFKFFPAETSGGLKALKALAAQSVDRMAERGIVLTGGGALLKDIDKLLMEETGLPVLIADDPLTCVARGGGRVLEMIEDHGPEVLALE